MCAERLRGIDPDERDEVDPETREMLRHVLAKLK